MDLLSKAAKHRRLQRQCKEKLSRRRYLFAESADGSQLRIGAPGVTFNAGIRAAKLAISPSARQRKRITKRLRREFIEAGGAIGRRA